MKNICLSFLLYILIGVIATAQPVTVSIEEVTQYVAESENASVRVVLSKPSFLPIEVPFTIEGFDGAVLDDDYEIGLDAEGDTFASPLTFDPGITEITIPILIINDDLVEGDERIVFSITADSVTVAKPIEPLIYTIIIKDDDDLEVFFPVHSMEFSEDFFISVEVRLTSPAEENIEVPFTITPGTASADDYELSDEDSNTEELLILAGLTSGVLSIQIVNDNFVDALEEETVIITMGIPVFQDSDNVIPGDDRPFIATIVDNDPVTLSVFVDEENEILLNRVNTEFGGTIFVIELSSFVSETVVIPFTTSGNAIEGEDAEDGDYFTSDNPLLITAGLISGTITVFINNDSLVEGDETINITLGVPTLEETGTTLGIIGENTFSVTIEDNDPVSLSFGVVYAIDDEEDDPIDFIESDQLIVSERSGLAEITIFLSSPSPNDVTFTLDLVAGSTTATAMDPDLDEDEQNWDYFIVNADIDFNENNDDEEITILAGLTTYVITIPSHRK